MTPEEIKKLTVGEEVIWQPLDGNEPFMVMVVQNGRMLNERGQTDFAAPMLLGLAGLKLDHVEYFEREHEIRELQPVKP